MATARKKIRQTRIMVFGTFDIVHKGHLHFFRQARRLSRKPYLIVSIARDANVKKIKGKRPRQNERQRLKQVQNSVLVDKAMLGGLKDYLSHIVTAGPNIIALGYDQTAYTKGLHKALAARGLRVKIVRLKAYKPTRYKTSLLRPTKEAVDD